MSEDTTKGSINSLLLNAEAGRNCGGIARGTTRVAQGGDLKHRLAVRPSSAPGLMPSLLWEPRV